MAQIQIDEAEHKRLTSEAAKVQAVEAERDDAVKRAELAEAKIAEAHKAADDAQIQRVIESAGVEFSRLELAGLRADLPLTEAGRLDVPVLEKRIAEAAAEVKERAGVGRPYGVGATDTGTQFSESDYRAALGIDTKEA